MDKIYRKISLEDFKNRFPSFKDGQGRVKDSFETEWGGIPKDYRVYKTAELYKLRKKIPLINDIDSNYARFRFGTFISMKTWLDNIASNSSLFYLCQRKEGAKWISQKTFSIRDMNDMSNVKLITTELPPEDDFNVDDKVWVTESAEEVINRFSSGDTADSVSNIFWRIRIFYNTFENFKIDRDTTDYPIQYAVLNLTLTENCNEVGKFTKGATSWEPKIIYSGGTYVINPSDNKAYHLSGDTGVTESAETFNEDSAWTPTEEIIELGKTTAFTESSLDFLRRVKRSYDDNGNELPFIYNGTESGETLYATGVTYNTSVEGDKVYGDVITAITNSLTTITFHYVIGAEIGNNSTPIDGTGIAYEEGYKMSVDSFTFRQNNANVTVEYKNIHFNEELSDYLPEGADTNKRYAKITFNPVVHQIDSGVPFIMEESMVGITDVKKSGTATVERGTAAAFEMHNILGECRTMEDLEKYRNDFFTIKDDEKQ